MAKVVVAAGARKDIKRLARLLAAHGGIAPAVDFADSIVALSTRLESFPKICALRPRLGPGIRVAVLAPYLALYRHSETDDRVVILRVLHGRRNITADFLKMP